MRLHFREVRDVEKLPAASIAAVAERPAQMCVPLFSWVEFVRRPEVRRHVVFLSDFDLVLAEWLGQGADLWINTPRRPWEACGTSGMKVLVNGGLNLSELDSWAEAYSPTVGWALGDGKEHDDDSGWDLAETEELYDIPEKKVVPAFYNRDDNGIAMEGVA